MKQFWTCRSDGFKIIGSIPKLVNSTDRGKMPHAKMTEFRFVIKTLLITVVLAASSTFGVAQQPADSDSDELFVFKPKTPSRQVRGAILAERLNRPEIGRGYLEDLINSQPTVDTLLSLRREFGIGAFLKMGSTPDLQPTGRELLQLINEASVREAPSENTVKLLIEELGQTPKQTREAVLRILAANEAAVMPLLQADLTTDQGKLATRLLNGNARRFRFGLINALPDAQDDQKVRILNLLSGAASPEIALTLVRYQFSQSTDVSTAAKRALVQLTNGTEYVVDRKAVCDKLVDASLAMIDRATKRYPTTDDGLEDRNLRRYYNTEDESFFGSASLARATVLAGDAVALMPDDSRCLAALQVAEITEQSWPARWPTDVQVSRIDEDLPPPLEKDVLAMQMAIDSSSTVAMLTLMQNTRTATAVFKDRPAVERQYLLFSDARVRLLAAAISRSAGRNGMHVRNAIEAAIGADELPEAVVIDSRSGESASVAAVLATSRIDATASLVRTQTGRPATNEVLAAELGMTVEALQEFRGSKQSPLSREYQSVATNSGRSGFIASTRQMQCELLLVHSNCLKWSISHTISNLRSDYRTRATPIVIYGPERDAARTQTIRSQYEGVWFLAEPLSEFTFTDRIQIEHVPGPLLTMEERKQMIRFARDLN